MLWEQRTYSFFPGKRDLYLKMWGEEILPLYDEIGVRIVGCWLPDDDLLQYVWLRVYDDAAERDAKTVALRTHEKWPDISRRIREYESGTATRDLVETTFSKIGTWVRTPSGSGAEPWGRYENRLLTIRPGQRDRFLDVFEHGFARLHRDAGIDLFGCWLPADSADQFIWVRAFRDDADEAAKTANLSAHPDFGHVQSALHELRISGQLRVLRPTTFNPTGRYVPSNIAS